MAVATGHAKRDGPEGPSAARLVVAERGRPRRPRDDGGDAEYYTGDHSDEGGNAVRGRSRRRHGADLGDGQDVKNVARDQVRDVMGETAYRYAPHVKVTRHLRNDLAGERPPGHQLHGAVDRGQERQAESGVSLLVPEAGTRAFQTMPTRPPGCSTRSNSPKADSASNQWNAWATPRRRARSFRRAWPLLCRPLQVRREALAGTPCACRPPVRRRRPRLRWGPGAW